jgi:hypothetical protein
LKGLCTAVSAVQYCNTDSVDSFAVAALQLANFKISVFLDFSAAVDNSKKAVVEIIFLSFCCHWNFYWIITALPGRFVPLELLQSRDSLNVDSLTVGKLNGCAA